MIVHPGGMHIIQSFVGCIGKLMKSSGLEVYIAAAYGGLTGKFDSTIISSTLIFMTFIQVSSMGSPG